MVVGVDARVDGQGALLVAGEGESGVQHALQNHRSVGAHGGRGGGEAEDARVVHLRADIPSERLRRRGSLSEALPFLSSPLRVLSQSPSNAPVAKDPLGTTSPEASAL